MMLGDEAAYHFRQILFCRDLQSGCDMRYYFLCACLGIQTGMRIDAVLVLRKEYMAFKFAYVVI